MFKNFSNNSGVALLRFLVSLPYKTLVSIGYGLGYLAAHIPSDRNRVVQKNLELCFPELSSNEINELRKQHWRLLGRSLVEKSIIWLGTKKQLDDMIEVRSEVDLSDRKPRILVNMHFIGIEGSIILSALAHDRGWPRTSGFFQRMKSPFFNRKIIEWRNRFGGKSIARQSRLLELIREIKSGNFIFIAPDIDLGPKDSVFVPFFGIQTNTITAISRLARACNAEVCLMITTLNADRSKYICRIQRALENFPSDDPVADTARLNRCFEDEIRKRPAEYYWVHKRFKYRPPGETNLYD